MSDRLTFLEACRTINAAGMVVVRKDSNDRLRKWLDQTNGWPPASWEPVGALRGEGEE